MKRTLPCFLALAALLGLTALLGGCGGGWDDCCGYDYPRTIDLTFAWKVTDTNGNPIGGVHMWVDDAESQFLTDPVFTELGRNYPYEWQGWLANWTSNEYSVVLGYENDRRDIVLRATKAGYNDAFVTIEITDADADLTYVRGTFVMTAVSGGGVAAPTATPAVTVERQAADAGFKRDANQAPKYLITKDGVQPAGR